MFDVTIDQLPLIGVNLSSALFNMRSTNDTQSLVAFYSLLQNGIQTFTLDLEERNNMWMVPKTNITFSDFLTTFQTFINATDDNLSANVLVLLLNISSNTRLNATRNSTKYSVASPTNISDSSTNITYLLDQDMGRQRIYTPEDLANDRSTGSTFNVSGLNNSGWPKLETFLYLTKRRLLIAELTNNLDQQTPYIFDSSVLYFDKGNASLSSPNTTDDYKTLTEVAWRFLDSQFNPTDIRQYMNLGYSPIISNAYSIANISGISSILNTSIIWSWGNNQPLILETSANTQKTYLTANNCAVLKYSPMNSSSYWIVDNCYDQFEGLCKDPLHAYTWLITETKETYFAFDSNSDSKCPEGYSFALPRTPLEQASLLKHLYGLSAEARNIWIDLNSIAVSNCWVTGGPYAACPYQKTVSRRNFVEMLTPVTVCSFAILVMVSYLNLLRIPIHNNRKSWKRIVNEVSKSEMEGVPS